MWTDFNPHAVQWLEILVHEWDGRDFTEFTLKGINTD